MLHVSDCISHQFICHFMEDVGRLCFLCIIRNCSTEEPFCSVQINGHSQTCRRRSMERYQLERLNRLSIYFVEPTVYMGTPSPEGYVPWQARLINTGRWPSSHLCGGTILDEYWILTAAHCIG